MATSSDSSRPHTFITIPASHFVEKARWALDLGEVAYEEHGAPPMLHYGLLLSNGFLSKTVPALVTPAGVRIGDSADILRYVHQNFHTPAAQALYPADPAIRTEVEELEALYGKTLGVWARVAVYFPLFQKPEVLAATVGSGPGVSSCQRGMFRTMQWPIVFLMRKGMNVTQENSDQCRAKLRDMFAQVSERLSDGRPFLVRGTNRPSAADIAFASLGAVLLQDVPNYGGGAGIKLPRAEDIDPEFAAYSKELTETPAGQFILRMFRSHRMAV